MIYDKRNVLSKLDSIQSLNLEVGCGSKKISSDFIGIDILDFDCVDIVGDIFDVLKEIPSNSVDKIFSRHFFEHINDLSTLIDEFSRILKVDGKIKIIVPHFTNPYYYSDYTHTKFFGLYSFCYLAKDNFGLTRKVPAYKKTFNLELYNVKLIFSTNPGVIILSAYKKFLTYIFNLSTPLMEFYEENLCYIFPCYELVFYLKKSDIKYK